MAFFWTLVFALAPASGVATVLTMAMSDELGAIVGGNFWAAVLLNCIAIACCLVGAIYGPSFQDTWKYIKSAWESEPIALFCPILAGICGGYFMCTGVILPPIIGYGIHFVSLVCTEILASLLVEFTGILWSNKVPLKYQTIIGSGLVLVGTVLFQVETLVDSSTISGSNVWMIALSLLAGIILVVQTALVRKANTVWNSPFRTLVLVQMVSTVVIIIAAVVAEHNPTFDEIVFSRDWWKIFLGGFFSACYVAILVILPGFIGYAATVGWLIFGQLVTSFILDSFGAFGVDKISVTALRIVGLIVVLLGVMLVQLSKSSAFQQWLDSKTKMFKKSEDHSPVATKPSTTNLASSKQTSMRASRRLSSTVTREFGREFEDIPLVAPSPTSTSASDSSIVPIAVQESQLQLLDGRSRRSTIIEGIGEVNRRLSEATQPHTNI